MKEMENITDPRTACWQLLERYLQRYDTPDTNFKYHLVVVDKILSTDPRIKLPLWLVASFKVKNICLLKCTNTIFTTENCLTKCVCVCVQYPPLVDVSFPLLKGETTTFTTLSTPSSSIPSRGENVAALLRIYLKYNLLEDAAELLVYIFERTQVFFLKNNGTSFPTLEDVIF
jgi:hypothetical protein